MKNLFTLLLAVIPATYSYAQNDTDTLYYDKDWRGVENKVFASFYRVIPKSGDPNFRKPFRDYYITGELRAEGYFLTIDKYDDSNSVFIGDFTKYFKNGKIESKGSRVDGKLDGELIEYYENGLIAKKTNFADGIPHGLYTEFPENGEFCYQMEYRYGEPRFDWYMVSDLDGNCSKIRYSDNTPIYESPEISEKKIEYQRGEAWPYYNKNGLMVGVSNKLIKDYGKWYQIPIVISNNSLFPIDFDPDEIKAVLTDKNGEERDLRVYSANDYIKRVKKRQNWSLALACIAEGLSAEDAGYSTSYTTTTTTTHSFSNSSSYGTASTYGSSRYARGSFRGNTLYHSTTTSTTTTYDGLAAYQAQVIASNRMAEYRDALLSERQAKDAGYLKLTTIYPGETISGYVNIERKKGHTLYIYVKIKDATYTFPWNVSK